MSASGDGAARPSSPAGILSLDDFAALRGAVDRESGILLGKEKIPQLSGIVLERMRENRLEDPGEYLSRILGGPRGAQELRVLIGRLVVGETSFFRNPAQFRLLQERILPELASGGTGFPIPVWSAGCATGEEPYSIVIAALEAFRGRCDEPVRVLATDIHSQFLADAREGFYPASEVRDMPPALVEKYFIALPDGRLRLRDVVRRLVTFEEGNLATYRHESLRSVRFSVIFCRNVMIYFRPEVMRRLVGEFHGSLGKGGLLFLGHSETLWGISDSFRLEEREGVYYYRRREADSVSSAAGTAAPATPGRRSADAPAPRRAANPARRAPAEPSGGKGPARTREAPRGAGPIVAQAEAQADRGAFREAERLCRAALEADPECAEAAYLLAVILRRQGRISEALIFAERSEAADARFVLAGVEAAECLQLLGNKTDAAARWESLLGLLDGPARFPRLVAAGFTAGSLREYVRSRLSR